MSNDFHVHEVNPFYVQAVGEHRDLHAAVDRIRHVLEGRAERDAATADVAAAKALILALRERLARHFAQEEEGGYLDEAVTRVPKMAPQARSLQRQHHEFLDLADAMLVDAGSDEATSVVWSKLKSDYVSFAKRLSAHEAAEDVLLQRAFNEDPGTEL